MEEVAPDLTLLDRDWGIADGDEDTGEPPTPNAAHDSTGTTEDEAPVLEPGPSSAKPPVATPEVPEPRPRHSTPPVAEPEDRSRQGQVRRHPAYLQEFDTT